MNLQEILPIIDEIVKESLNDRVYIYGKTGRSLTRRVATGNLRNSIRSEVVQLDQGIQIIQMEAFGVPLRDTYAYWLMVDRRPGGRPPTRNIEQWIRDKKDFKMRNMKTGRFIEKNDKNIKSAAYVISRSIGKFGFQNKPENFGLISKNKLLEDKRIDEIMLKEAMNELTIIF